MTFGLAELAQDKAKTLTQALLWTLVFVMGGWGFSTWWNLRAPSPEATAPPTAVVPPNDLRFLLPTTANEFSVRGHNPFFAPAPIPPSKPSQGQGAGKPVPTAIAVVPKYKSLNLIYRGTHKGDDGQPLALVEDTASQKSLFLKIGDSIQGGHVVDIHTDQVLWEKSGQPIPLKLGQPYSLGTIRVP